MSAEEFRRVFLYVVLAWVALVLLYLYATGGL